MNFLIADSKQLANTASYSMNFLIAQSNQPTNTGAYRMNILNAGSKTDCKHQYINQYFSLTMTAIGLQTEAHIA